MQQFASKLYSRASSIVATYTLLGLLIGAGSGLGALKMGSLGQPIMIGAIVICAMIGYSIGSEKAFWLRLQAQTALCQVEIELNTRAAAAGARVNAAA